MIEAVATLAYRHHSSGKGDPVTIGIMLGVMVLVMVLIVYFAKEARIRRQLRDTPRWASKHLPEGRVGRIVGKAQPLTNTLIAPLSGRPCVYYIATARTRAGKHAKTIAIDRRFVQFAVVDDTGRAVVDPFNADLALVDDYTALTSKWEDLTPLQRRFLDGAHHTGTNSLSFREAIIAVDETVAVMGAGVREPDPDAIPGGEAGYRDEQPTRLRLASSPSFTLKISDHPMTVNH